MTQILDCLIIGGGPTGTAAAISCQREGLNFRLLSPVPAGEAPGPVETISSPILPLLEALALSECFALATVSRVERFVRDGRQEPFAHPSGHGLHIDRANLDRRLHQHVGGMGDRCDPLSAASIDEDADGFLVTTDDGSLLRSRVLVNATGRAGAPFARFAKKRTLLSPPMIATTGLINCEADFETSCTSFESRSWGWIWRTGDHDGSRTWTTVHCALEPEPSEVSALKERTRADTCWARGTTWQIVRIDHPRILSVGDAFGHTDPASGQGIANALRMGLACGKVAARALSHDAAEETDAFNRWCEDLILSQADELSRYYEERGILNA